MEQQAFDFVNLEEPEELDERSAEDKERFEEWKRNKKEARARFSAMQTLPYEVKKKRAVRRVIEFVEEMDNRDCNAHVSVGGLDSIVLLMFIRHVVGIDVPSISVSSAEDKSIQQVHRALGIERVKSIKNKTQVIQEVGFPVISKRIAGKIDLLQHPTEDNKTARHAIITGECGEQGHFAKNSRMQLPKKWLFLFAGMANGKYGTEYLEAPFLVSNKCCYYIKEKPCDDWAKAHNSYPFLGMMASEGGQREEALVDHGCNYYGKTVMRSAPFAPFMRQDILTLGREMDELRKNDLREKYETRARETGKLKEDEFFPESIIPTIYGTIEEKEDGTLYTTKAQRTGCSMCGFGIHMEERPHRFDRLRERNYKEWHFWMYECCVGKETGEKYGWGMVLDWIGVEWEDYPAVQMDMFRDFTEGMA